jgi:hypothetical protein
MGAVYGRMLVEDIETAGRNADWPDAVRTVAMLDKELAVLQVQLGEFVQEEQTCEF